MTNDFEVGWYGVAANIAGLAMLLTPIIASVFLPLSSRAAARSEEEVAVLSRRAMHYTLAVAIPVTLALALSADFLVDHVFGHRFAPSAPTLRVLAPTFVLTYVAMLTSLVLMAVGRGWALTKVALSALVVTPLLHLLFIPWGLRHYGPGGAGVGAAIASVVSELYLAALMAWMVRRLVFDRVGFHAVAKMLLVTAGVVALHVLLAPLGDWRLVADAVVYVSAVQLWGAVDFRLIVRSVRLRAPMAVTPA
jgi:O-antigen/teichoic acid export membrane protein